MANAKQCNLAKARFSSGHAASCEPHAVAARADTESGGAALRNVPGSLTLASPTVTDHQECLGRFQS